ncbi:HEPN domain-containing protein [Marinifilum flexuosum]|uniref:HEPN domain-containing protein n=1 Tax=Marinifilum flexuosum TaxID=1117708 RepID=UPI0024945EDA|nr:HEPN domain-containing protein [Marinifilum flexuosum]
MKKDLKELYRNALIDGLTFIDNFLEETRKKEYWWDIKKYDEYPSMSYFDSGLPSFSKHNSEKIDYSGILNKNSKCEELDSWKNYHDYVCASEKLTEFYGKQYFVDSDSSKSNDIWRKIYTYYVLAGFVDRYIHLNPDKTKFNEELFNSQFNKWYNSVNEKKLYVEIHVPILFVDFEFDEVQISDNILIKRMDEKLQLSRHQKVSYTDSSKNTVAGAASHALVLKNWNVDNMQHSARENILYDINSYNSIIEIVESFFSVFRVTVGVFSGFSQIVSKATNWEDRTKGDLYHVNVVSTRRYPDFFDNYGWLNSPKIIKKEDVVKTAKYFENVRNTKANRIKLALSRLNTSYLRSREEDTILDITIALETILTHDSQSEITYRLSSRIAALCLIKPFKDYSEFQVFEFCKKIYSFRSAVVHGDSKRIGKTRKVKIQENEEIETIIISLELLRHVLGILIENPLYNNPIEIDKLKYKSTEPNKSNRCTIK